MKRIEFKCQSFYLKEFYAPSMDISLLKEFLEFCYLGNEDDIDIDYKYWIDSRLFLVFHESKIVGCVSLITKNREKLPTEYSTLINYNINFDTSIDTKEKVGEIYRLKVLPNMNRIAMMLFKAICISANQENLIYTYISYDLQSSSLKNLYLKKLIFSDAGLVITYDNKKEWGLLRKDWIFHENKFKEISKRHSEIFMFFNENVKSRSFKIEEKNNDLWKWKLDEKYFNICIC